MPLPPRCTIDVCISEGLGLQLHRSTIPIPFSVFPSSYRNVSKDAVKESTNVKVEAEAKLPQAGREGHSEHKESFAVNVKPAERRETSYTEDVRVFEDRTRRPPPPPPQQQHHREEVRIHEEHRYRQPEPQQHTRREHVEVDVHTREHRDHFQPPRRPYVDSHIDVKDTTYDREFNAVSGTTPAYGTSQIDVSERQFRERTRPIVTGHVAEGHSNLSTYPSNEQASGYRKETFVAKHDTYPRRSERETVDSRYPSRDQVRVESTRTTVDEPKKFKRDMGYYDEDGHYHSFRHGISKAAHKVADHIVHPIHGHRHHHSHSHSNVGSKHEDRREEVIVKGKYSTSAPPPPPSVAAPLYRSSSTTVHSHAPAPAPIYRPSVGPSVSHTKVIESSSRKMTPPNTITIPCHHIRIGDLLILQGRPCQVIRITTSSQTGQHRYLGVDLFTKQLHEESSFISNPAPSVVVQNMLGPVFKQYRVLDIREDGRVVAMTETGDVKQGLPVLDQSNLLNRLTESFDNGRGSVRILVINDEGLEMAVDYKVVHGSRL
ncbi:hypothetical protein K458DRAFT_395907 [Lentithecium fluviatile CBS 122367]|uniref:Uncharacterized protein n=1 Tax=Lentithecium fluviatile CBS 122367 TaxID=1168545 RepID=A0A6G1IHN3_9PLEO|nr:hypothetical protein K458DRAFT_395907 [Lentithecium fluviatile CBS 122367]